MRLSRKDLAFYVLVLTAVVLPFTGPVGIVVGTLLACALLGLPLFALIGFLSVACFLVFGDADLDPLVRLTALVERITNLSDQEDLLAVPLFMLSGSVMARGQISARLIDFSKAVIGWIPGGLAVSAVLACMLFAAISGSSPATVVAIGGMMAPTLIRHGYPDTFSHGLLTSSGSLGILIPPSIPMILYPLINQRAGIETSALFAAGFGPGLVIGAILAGLCVYHGIRDGAEREAFSLATLGQRTFDGFWSLLFPITILGGIYTGFFTVVEAAGFSVVYAVVVEVAIHRALSLKDVPAISKETGVILGALLVIMVSALAFSEFLHLQEVPAAAAAWIESMNLSPLMFLVIVNLLLLVVGMLMDIISAMFLFVPLLAPMAMSMGIDPMHFGIIFIVNLEIGYLTPPVGLNLFVASTLWNKSMGHMVRSVGPFIVAMIGGLALITYFPSISIGFGSWILGEEERPAYVEPDPLDDEPLDDLPDDAEGTDDEMPSMEEMMEEAEDADPSSANEPDHPLTMEEMMELAEEQAEDEPGEDEPSEEPEEEPSSEPALPNRPMTMEEMMEAAGVE
ncbi:MAG: TRAP transporter large permease [Sandaracinaceae bacterium]